MFKLGVVDFDEGFVWDFGICIFVGDLNKVVIGLWWEDDVVVFVFCWVWF